jgi:GR25 family glycosyltransferase involved in LPS biosynthesis
MAQQLASAPQGVYRQPAVDQVACDLPDDARTLYGNRNHTAEKSLFCSNYMIWQRAQRSDADFVVILEDDAVLAPNFWQSVGEFMQTCSSFDYLTVDSWKAGGDPTADRTTSCLTSDAGSRLYRPNPNKYLDYWGTQAQIIRTSFLDTLIRRAQLNGMGPMDVWWMTNINEGRAFSWQPGLVSQASKGRAPFGCVDSVVQSDIMPIFFQRAAPNHTKAGGPPRLQCE